MKSFAIGIASVTAALMAASALQPVLAQGRIERGGPNRAYNDGYSEGYNDGYREAYRKGYDDGRRGGRFDDRPEPRRDRDFRGPPVAAVPPPPVRDRDELWRRRYANVYTYNDDVYYRECRNTVDPAGVIAGAIIGGLTGNLAGRGNGGATVAGVILGGTVGAALTKGLDCADRSYAYKAYHDGFTSNRPNSNWAWRNPSNGHYGDFVVGEYYDDEDGFRCSTYSQRIFVSGRAETANGRACQQPDGTWAVVQ